MRLKASFRDALDNDLNTSLAITALYDVLKSPANDATKLAAVADFDSVLSLGLIEAADKKRNESAGDVDSGADSELASKIEEMIAERTDAKKAKDFARADAIRDELGKMGITLVDTKEGTTWKRS